MLEYRKLAISEANRINEIDATHFIRNVWRINKIEEYELVEINWTDAELPNGFDWHLTRLKESLARGGTAFGCFDRDTLVGYAVVDKTLFGVTSKYALLDQLFVSQSFRRKGIGKRLFTLCAEQAVKYGAYKLFICAGSAENTIAFYKSIGCVLACEHNQKLHEEDPRDIQMEYRL